MADPGRGGCVSRAQLGGGSGRGGGSVRRGMRGSRSNSEGVGQRLGGEASAQPGGRIRQRWPRSTGRRGHSPGSGLPRRQAEAGRAQDSKDAPARS